MPSSTVRSFVDADEYAAAIRSTEAELTVTARGQFTAKLTRIDLHHLWMQRFSERLPRIVHSVAPPGRSGISFRTLTSQRLNWNRTQKQPSIVIRHVGSHDAFRRSSGSLSFGAMTLPTDEMASVVAAVSGRDLTPSRSELSVTLRPAAMATLQRLHMAAGDLADSAPEVIAHPGSARGLEQALVQAMIACLSTAAVEEDTSAKRRHTAIMRRFHAAIAEHREEAIYIPDICAAVGVSQRTLHACCHETLGIGPKRYLQLRRLNLARQALRKAGAATTTVSDIAAGFGFWNFGRFAVEYKAMFGEAPSATLHRPRQ